ncbi:Clp protease N-terminal domain-containing protein [Catenuloplanes atrovinosus]|uniref:Uncharacterized protein n=1 Tax=Catenuloplanes atrovinosus TaxID=137266 RepID=A0AAE3YSA6_9ACTN|nr:Clp protease N-terminal domain-containing protein [Catenuloplanes atrovinosus]MDR7276891.1 hypothetical protein [Catenuloplanes atrovinosus]
MSMLDRFDDVARRAIVRAGLLAREAGRDRLDDETLLVALAASARVATRLGVPADAVRDACPGAAAGRDRELLAALGIDLDEVRDRLPVRIDDPARWRLHRPIPLPLRVRLTGPGVSLVLTEPARKAVEVALNLRGYGTPVTEDGLLRGVLADRRTPSFRALRRLRIDLPRLATSVYARG